MVQPRLSRGMCLSIPATPGSIKAQKDHSRSNLISVAVLHRLGSSHPQILRVNLVSTPKTILRLRCLAGTATNCLPSMPSTFSMPISLSSAHPLATDPASTSCPGGPYCGHAAAVAMEKEGSGGLMLFGFCGVLGDRWRVVSESRGIFCHRPSEMCAYSMSEMSEQLPEELEKKVEVD